MRILPDLHFKENYKKHYDENYAKIHAKIEEQTKIRQARVYDPELLKYKIVGFVASVVIIGSFFGIGYIINSKFTEKEKYIAELNQSILLADKNIKQYQIINGDAMKSQIDEVVTNITALQNAYLSQTFSDDFTLLSDYYLGDYNNDWSSDMDLTNPLWTGCVNKAHTFDDTCSFVFILTDNKNPVMFAEVYCSLDDNGNLGKIVSVRKARLT